MDDYEKQINALIPEAERLASSRLTRSKKARYINKPGKDGKDFRWCMWTQYFHEEMKRLAIESGLRTA